MKTLNDIPKKNNFKAPEGYFDEFPGKLQDKIQSKKQRAEKPGFFTVLKPYLYFTGFFLALAFVIKLGLNTFTGDYHQPAITANNTVKEDDYFEYDLISEELIYTELTTEESETNNELSEEAIIAYLTLDEVASLVYSE